MCVFFAGGNCILSDKSKNCRTLYKDGTHFQNWKSVIHFSQLFAVPGIEHYSFQKDKPWKLSNHVSDKFTAPYYIRNFHKTKQELETQTMLNSDEIDELRNNLFRFKNFETGTLMAFLRYAFCNRDRLPALYAICHVVFFQMMVKSALPESARTFLNAVPYLWGQFFCNTDETERLFTDRDPSGWLSLAKKENQRFRRSDCLRSIIGDDVDKFPFEESEQPVSTLSQIVNWVRSDFLTQRKNVVSEDFETLFKHLLHFVRTNSCHVVKEELFKRLESDYGSTESFQASVNFDDDSTAHLVFGHTETNIALCIYAFVCETPHQPSKRNLSSLRKKKFKSMPQRYLLQDVDYKLLKSFESVDSSDSSDMYATISLNEHDERNIQPIPQHAPGGNDDDATMVELESMTLGSNEGMRPLESVISQPTIRLHRLPVPDANSTGEETDEKQLLPFSPLTKCKIDQIIDEKFNDGEKEDAGTKKGDQLLNADILDDIEKTFDDTTAGKTSKLDLIDPSLCQDNVFTPPYEENPLSLNNVEISKDDFLPNPSLNWEGEGTESSVKIVIQRTDSSESLLPTSTIGRDVSCEDSFERIGSLKSNIDVSATDALRMENQEESHVGALKSNDEFSFLSAADSESGSSFDIIPDSNLRLPSGHENCPALNGTEETLPAYSAAKSPADEPTASNEIRKLQETCEIQQRELRELRTQTKELELRFEEANRSHADTVKENEALKQELVKKDDAFDKLTRTNEAFKTEMSLVNLDKDDTNVRLQQYEEKLLEAKREKERLVGELQNLKDRGEIDRSDIESLRAQNDDVGYRHGHLVKRVQELEAMHEEELNRVKIAQKKTVQELQCKSGEMESASIQLQSLRNLMDQLQVQKRQLEADIEKLNRSVRVMECDTRGRKRQIETLECQLAKKSLDDATELYVQNAQLMGQNETLEEKCQALQKEVSARNAQMAGVLFNASKSNNELKLLQQTKEVLESELKRKGTEIASLEAQVASTFIQDDETKNKVENLAKEWEEDKRSYVTEIDRLRTEEQVLTSEVASKKDAADSLALQLESFQNKYDVEIKRSMEAIEKQRSLQEKILSMEREMLEAQKVSDEAESMRTKEKCDMEKRFNDKEEQLQRLQKQYESTVADDETTRCRLKSLQSDFEAAVRLNHTLEVEKQKRECDNVTSETQKLHRGKDAATTTTTTTTTTGTQSERQVTVSAGERSEKEGKKSHKTRGDQTEFKSRSAETQTRATPRMLDRSTETTQEVEPSKTATQTEKNVSEGRNDYLQREKELTLQKDNLQAQLQQLTTDYKDAQKKLRNMQEIEKGNETHKTDKNKLQESLHKVTAAMKKKTSDYISLLKTVDNIKRENTILNEHIDERTKTIKNQEYRISGLQEKIQTLQENLTECVRSRNEEMERCRRDFVEKSAADENTIEKFRKKHHDYQGLLNRLIKMKLDKVAADGNDRGSDASCLSEVPVVEGAETRLRRRKKQDRNNRNCVAIVNRTENLTFRNLGLMDLGIRDICTHISNSRRFQLFVEETRSLLTMQKDTPYKDFLRRARDCGRLGTTVLYPVIAPPNRSSDCTYMRDVFALLYFIGCVPTVQYVDCARAKNPVCFAYEEANFESTFRGVVVNKHFHELSELVTATTCILQWNAESIATTLKLR